MAGFNSEPESLDWVNLPAGAEMISASAALHGAELLPSSRFFPEDRRLELVLRVPRLSSESKWRLVFIKIESLRVALFHDLPADGRQPNGFEESVSWGELLTRVQSSRCDFIEADHVKNTQTSSSRFRFGLRAPYVYGELWVRAESMCIETSDQLGPERDERLR